MSTKQQIPGYKLIERLGKGGQANVYRAVQLSMNRQVAVKVIPPSRNADPTELARFMREARVLARLRHDNIVQAIDYGEVEGYRYLVMEFIEGETVLDLIASDGKVAVERAADIVMQVCLALQYASELGVIHRDVKPANIVITTSGRVVLVDFGLARPEETDLELTMAGTTVGTPHYMSPEQIRAVEALDIRADIYALGSTFYHMITGRVPFPSDSKAEILASHLREPVKLPKDLPVGIPDEIYRIIQRSMEKDRTKRYQTPKKMARELEDALRKVRGEVSDGMDTSARLRAVSDERDKLMEYTRMLESRMKALEERLSAGGVLPMDSGAMAAQNLEPARARVEPSIMVLVSGGKFTAGEDEGKDVDSPRREVHVDGFWIEPHPVTNRDYGEFVKATGRAPPDHWKGSAPPDDILDHPVVYVTYSDAEAFADWAGKRLPSPLEWQKAARGADARRFPWGNQEDTSRLNCKESELGRTTKVGFFKRDVSPYGCLDMGGNVAEWVQGSFGGGAGPIIRAVCGGSFRDSISRSLCASRRGYHDGGKASHVGFRCATDE